MNPIDRDDELAPSYSDSLGTSCHALRGTDGVKIMVAVRMTVLGRSYYQRIAKTDGRRDERAVIPGSCGGDRGAGRVVRLVPELSADGGPDQSGAPIARTSGAVGRDSGDADRGRPAVPAVYRSGRGGAEGMVAASDRPETGRPGPLP